MRVHELRVLLEALEPHDFIYVETERGKRPAEFAAWHKGKYGLCGVVLQEKSSCILKKKTSDETSEGKDSTATEPVTVKTTLTRATPIPGRTIRAMDYQSYSYYTQCPATYGITMSSSNAAPDPTGVMYDMHWDKYGIGIECRVEVVYDPYYSDQNTNRGGGPGTPNTSEMAIGFFRHQTCWGASRLNRKVWDSVMRFTWREMALCVANRLYEDLPAFQAGSEESKRDHLNMKLAFCFLSTVEDIEKGKSPFHIILWNKWEDRVVLLVGAMLVESEKDGKFHNVARVGWEEQLPMQLHGVDGPRKEYFTKLENTRNIGHKLVEMWKGNEAKIQTWMGDGIGVGKPPENM